MTFGESQELQTPSAEIASKYHQHFSETMLKSALIE
jgi:hypothetical protein